jgi:hypothetical protein
MGSIGRFAAIAVTLTGVLASPGAASGEAAGEWTHSVVLYGMGAAIDGEAEAGGLTVPVDMGISEVFDALEMGAMAAWRADNGTWSVTTDATFMGLGGTASTEGGRVEGDLDFDQMTLMATVGRRWTDHLEVLFGLAYFDLSGELAVSGPVGERRAGIGVDWIDPTVGLAYSRPFAEKCRLNLRGDVGGFGVGSDLLVHLLASVRWQASPRVGVVAGYRVIRFDYADDGHAAQRYDLTEQGPAIGLAFSF